MTVPIRGAAAGRSRTRIADGLREIRTSQPRASLPARLRAVHVHQPAPDGSRRRRRHPRATRVPARPRRRPSSTARRRVPPPNPDPDPAPVTAGNLGGWYRGLDSQSGPVPLHDGLLSRDGWYLLDDTTSPLLDRRRALVRRAPGAPAGAYQDGYLFAYGDDYVAALADLPQPHRARRRCCRARRSATGSRATRATARATTTSCCAAFRARRGCRSTCSSSTPTTSAPRDWNGWQWTPRLLPRPEPLPRLGARPGARRDPQRAPVDQHRRPELRGRRRDGGRADRRRRPLPACSSRDPAASCAVWDWAQRDDVASYFALHAPFEARRGRLLVARLLLRREPRQRRRADARHLDQLALRAARSAIAACAGCRCRGSARRCSTTAAATAGAWAEHRNAIHFTGDTIATWEMLDFQTRFTAAEGAGIGLPYVSHDIGSFHGDELPGPTCTCAGSSPGCVQPILRLHSDHAPRLPWEYGGEPAEIAGAASCACASRSSPTSTRSPARRTTPACRWRGRCTCGWPRARRRLSIRPPVHARRRSCSSRRSPAPGDPARKRVWFPPGEWVDLFTGEVHSGPRAETLTRAARADAAVRPRGLDRAAPGLRRPRRQRGPDPLILNVYAGDDGSFDALRGRGGRLRLPAAPVHAHAAALERGRRLGDAGDRARSRQLSGRPGAAPLQRPHLRRREAEPGLDRIRRPDAANRRRRLRRRGAPADDRDRPRWRRDEAATLALEFGRPAGK